MAVNTNYNLPKLREILARASFTDLRIFVDDLNESYDAVVAESSNVREAALTITDYFKDRGREADLVERVQREYPLADWESVLLPMRWMLNEPFELEFIRIPAGPFLMGTIANHESQKRADLLAISGVIFRDSHGHSSVEETGTPQHTNKLPDFYISKFPITNAQWRIYCVEIHSKQFVPAGKDDHPVQNASWSSARDFSHSDSLGRPTARRVSRALL